MRLPLSSIVVSDRLRDADPARVQELAESIRQNGLINPLIVDRRHCLVAGLHRLQAVRSLGWTDVPVVVKTLDEDQARLIEIDENLARADLTPLDRAEALLQRKVIYERLHPNVRARGRRRKSEPDSELPFSQSAAVLGIDERTVQQDIAIATGLAEDVKQLVRRSDRVTRRDLLSLCRETADDQRAAMALVSAGASVGQALAQLSGDDALPSGWQLQETVTCPCCQQEFEYLHKRRTDQPGRRPVMSVVEGSNADLIADVAALYLRDGDRIADVTWGRGAFWRQVDLSRFSMSRSDAVTCLEAPYDFRSLPYEDAVFDVVVLDPPYMHDPGTPLVEDRYRNADTTKGMTHDDIIELYRQGMAEAKRILVGGGLLWVKTKDEVVGGRQRLSHIEIHGIAVDELGFSVEDLFGLLQGGRPLLQHKRQKHSRKNLSFLWVFRDGRPGRGRGRR